MPSRAVATNDEADDEGAIESLLTIHPRKLTATASRVVIRPFHLGWQSAASGSSRA